MKTKESLIDQITIEEFADKHGLVMEVFERRLPAGNPMRYYAHFESCDEIGDGVLIGTFGNGPTKEQAISEYAKQISLKRLAINGNSAGERRIDVPRLVPSSRGFGGAQP